LVAIDDTFGQIPLQKIMAFVIGNFSQKTLPYGFFAPISSMTKVPFWTSHFGPDCFDKVFLVGFFFIGFFLPCFFY
jgi:hypothetical protein